MSTLKKEAPNADPADFDAMNLQAGTKLQFVTYRSLAKAQYISTLIGWDVGEYMLVRLPRENGTALNFFDGEKVSVRVFSGTAICTFDTSVVKVIHHPLYCLCLTFPVSMQMKRLRREMRIKVALEATVVSAATPVESHQVALDNLSATGALISTTVPIGEVDEVVTVSFTLPSYDGEEAALIKMKAKIRNMVEELNADQRSYMVGTEFVEMDTTDQLMVRNYVYGAVLETRQSIV
ncbi:flagellar brake protein [Herminiimonas sp. NPDC097707]|uniref:flagellar brake protein n=1 Tax=Herminiimonas sp. NPDC097707 TaxID=3364007 RepID=UPI00383B1E33